MTLLSVPCRAYLPMIKIITMIKRIFARSTDDCYYCPLLYIWYFSSFASIHLLQADKSRQQQLCKLGGGNTVKRAAIPQDIFKVLHGKKRGEGRGRKKNLKTVIFSVPKSSSVRESLCALCFLLPHLKFDRPCDFPWLLAGHSARWKIEKLRCMSRFIIFLNIYFPPWSFTSFREKTLRHCV